MINGKMIIMRTVLAGAVIAAPAAPGSCQPEDRHPETLTETVTPGPIQVDPGDTRKPKKHRIEAQAMWHPSRRITVNLWIGEREIGDEFFEDRKDPDEGTFYREISVDGGTKIKMIVEQHNKGGFLQCSLALDGNIMIPGGYMHRNDTGDCVVEGQVPFDK